MHVRRFGRIVSLFGPDLARADGEQVGWNTPERVGDRRLRLRDGSAAQHVGHRLRRQPFRALERKDRPELPPDHRLDVLTMQSARRQVATPDYASEPSDGISAKSKPQGPTRDPTFQLRFDLAMNGREDATVAREVGVSKSTIGTYRRGALPAPAVLFKLEDALQVTPRWLATGEGSQGRSEESEADNGDWVNLPQYDILGFTVNGKPEPKQHVAVRRDWLGRVRNTVGLWLADMPSDAPDIGREGDILVCADATLPLVDGRAYVILLAGRPLVRKVRARRDGLELRTGDPADAPLIVAPDQVDDLFPLGRVVASIALRSI